MARLTHEQKVERFYSHGADHRARQDGGFLSFGYWPQGTLDYRQAAENLMALVLRQEKTLHRGSVLNVACGYGAETFRIWQALQPEKLVAIDVTEAHIDFASQAAEERQLAGRIVFQKMDACALTYESDSFCYIIGIEGPAHFNTRETFLRRAYDALEPGGVLLLTDIIAKRDPARLSALSRLVASFCSKRWHMPRANWMDLAEYRALLEAIGFEVGSFDSIGGLVFPGFARYNRKWPQIMNAVRTRGLWIGVGLTLISWLLGLVHRYGLTDYVYIRATKRPRSECGTS